MGVLAVDVRVARPGRRPRWKAFRRVLVDSGSEMTWLPESELWAAGVEVFKTVDEVVLGQAGDLSLLGARTFERFNAVVDARKRKLIPAGPMPAA